MQGGNGGLDEKKKESAYKIEDQQAGRDIIQAGRDIIVTFPNLPQIDETDVRILRAMMGYRNHSAPIDEILSRFNPSGEPHKYLDP
jgi:hypothetical protein